MDRLMIDTQADIFDRHTDIEKTETHNQKMEKWINKQKDQYMDGKETHK